MRRMISVAALLSFTVGVVANTEESWYPQQLVAIQYPQLAAQAQVEAALAQGLTSPGAMLAALGAAEVGFDGAAFVNLNTLQEFADAEAGDDLLEGEAPAQAGPKGVIE